MIPSQSKDPPAGSTVVRLYCQGCGWSSHRSAVLPETATLKDVDRAITGLLMHFPASRCPKCGALLERPEGEA